VDRPPIWEVLFGIATQPVIASYNHDGYQVPMRYALAYDAEGIVMDHHDQGIGVEKAHVRRVGPNSYQVRLVSYERILPVWEGVIIF
jgi:hypothetical protein